MDLTWKGSLITFFLNIEHSYILVPLLYCYIEKFVVSFIFTNENAFVFVFFVWFDFVSLYKRYDDFT